MTDLDKRKAKLADDVAAVGKLHPDDAKRLGVCWNCGLAPDGRITTQAGAREFKISGMCEVCFDETFPDE